MRLSSAVPRRLLGALLGGLAWIPCITWAQFDPARVARESPAVAARFPDPAVSYATPSLRPGRVDFATHAEVLDDLRAVQQRAPQGRVTVHTVGQSQQGLPIPLVLLSSKANGEPDHHLPTVLVIAQQHGNEPASGEAALALVHLLAKAEGPDGRAELLSKVNVLVMPRGNADGAERFVRATANGIDVNRDHLLLRTPEARAIASVVLKYAPQVVLDLHEFTAAGRWVDKFGVVQKYDALVQSATVGNQDARLAEVAEREYVGALKAAWQRAGLHSFAYHTTSPDARDKRVTMGGVQPDTGRNVSGLRPAISVLVEVRGVGLGRAHLLRRVHSSVLASLTAVQVAAQQGQALRRWVRAAEQATAAQACRGSMVVAARHSAGTQRMAFYDASNGDERAIDVAWNAATPLDVLSTRARPCGYVLAADQTDALQRLRWLGARLQPVTQAARWPLESYRVLDEQGGQRQDARGAIDDGEGGGFRQLNVALQAQSMVLGPGAWYVGLDQPLGALIAAALEPDSQSSLAASRLLEPTRVWRVMRLPPKSAMAAAVGPADPATHQR